MNKTIKNMLLGENFVELFQLGKLLIINLGAGIKVSFHIACLVRVIHKNNIILTSSDEFFDFDGNELVESSDSTVLKKDLYNPCSLLTSNINKVNALLKGAKIKKIRNSRIGDVELIFDNKAKIQIYIDYAAKCMECYRIIQYLPNYESKVESRISKHMVTICDRGKVQEILE